MVIVGGKWYLLGKPRVKHGQSTGINTCFLCPLPLSGDFRL